MSGDVLPPLEAGNADCGLHLAPPAARADRAEADASHGAHLQVVTVDGDPDGDDPEAMDREHIRQCRLARYQRQPFRR